MTLRKDKSTAGVVLIGLGVIALTFLGIRRESVRVIQREREAILRTDLRTIRDAIDNYTLDKHGHPKSLQDLVDAGYLRAIPVDPDDIKKGLGAGLRGSCSRGPCSEPGPKSSGTFQRTFKLQ